MDRIQRAFGLALVRNPALLRSEYQMNSISSVFLESFLT